MATSASPAPSCAARSAASSASWRGCSPRPSSAPRSTSRGPAPPVSRGCSASASWSGCATRSRLGSPTARLALRERAEVEAGNRDLLERMLADPAAYKWVRVYNARDRRAGLRVRRVPSPRRPARDADGVVAGEGLLRLPVMKPTPGSERPPAPWGSFPLAELTVLVGIAMLVIGLAGQNPTAIGVGLVLGALGGLEVSVREHFAGYRSHTTLLAGTVFVLTVGGPVLPRRPDPGDLPRGRRRRLRRRLPGTAPRLPARLWRPFVQGRRPPRLTGRVRRRPRTARRGRAQPARSRAAGAAGK